MGRTLNIQLPDDSTQTLDEIGRRLSRPAEDVARDLLERALCLASIRQSRERLRPKAEAAGYRSEDDLLDTIS